MGARDGRRALLAALGKFNEELVKAGVMLAGEATAPELQKRVVFPRGKRTVVDLTFAEILEESGLFGLRAQVLRVTSSFVLERPVTRESPRAPS